MAQLADLLANREWLRRASPFPHIVAWNVFREDFLAALSAQLRSILDRGLSETPDGERFSRNIANYDSYGIGLRATQPGPLGLFSSVGWRDMLCGLFGITRTPYVFAGAHYHTPGSDSGFIHNDFNPVWFPLATDDELRAPSHEICAYKTGAGSLGDDTKIEVVRGAVVIFYLLNDGWRPGDGGETGLFDSALSGVGDPRARVAPVNNSLVAFECSPRSFHTFLTNRRIGRASIIMWVHRPLSEATARFGAEKLERWR